MRLGNAYRVPTAELLALLGIVPAGKRAGHVDGGDAA
jgi:hypothetical protein